MGRLNVCLFCFKGFPLRAYPSRGLIHQTLGLDAMNCAPTGICSWPHVGYFQQAKAIPTPVPAGER